MTLPRLTALLLPLALLGPGCGGSTDTLKATPATTTLTPNPYNPETSMAARSAVVQENCLPAAPTAKEARKALVLGIVAEPVVKMLVNAADAQLKAELDKYTDVHQAGFVLGDFYSIPGAKPRYPCFHLERGSLAQKGGRGAMEFVGMIEPVMSQAGAEGVPRALRIKPLYVGYPTLPAAELGPDGTLGLSISLKMDAFWVANEQGRGGTQFDVSVLEDKLRFRPGQPLEKEYRDHQGVLVPLLPWAGGNSTAVYTVTVTEAGNPPQVLKWLHEAVAGNKDHLTSKIVEAAEAGL